MADQMRAYAQQRVSRISPSQRGRYEKNEAFGPGPENFGYERQRGGGQDAYGKRSSPVYRGGARPRGIPSPRPGASFERGGRLS